MLSAALGVTATVSAAPSATGNGVLPAPKQTESKPQPAVKKHRWFQIGKATWYGDGFNGKKTANGSVFNENAFTCAHRTLPLGSLVRVTNLSNHRSAVVRVTDRGPWVRNTVLDLSHAAARKLGFSGVAKVRIDEVKPGDLAPSEQAKLELPPVPTARSGR